MFWRKRIKKAKKDNLTKLEKSIVDYLILNLPQEQSDLIKKQLRFLTFVKRIEYTKDVITELYPEKYGTIPNELLLGRTEEFHLATIKYKINNVKYFSEIHMVMGSIFDLSIKPKPMVKKNLSIEFTDIEITEELNKNTIIILPDGELKL